MVLLQRRHQRRNGLADEQRLYLLQDQRAQVPVPVLEDSVLTDQLRADLLSLSSLLHY